MTAPVFVAPVKKPIPPLKVSLDFYPTSYLADDIPFQLDTLTTTLEGDIGAVTYQWTINAPEATVSFDSDNSSSITITVDEISSNSVYVEFSVLVQDSKGRVSAAKGASEVFLFNSLISKATI